MKRTTTILSMVFTGLFSLNAIAGDGIANANTPVSDGMVILKKGKESSSEGVKGKMMLTVGVGFNTVKSATVVRYDASSYFVNTMGGDATPKGGGLAPLYNIIFDYGLANKFTVGAGIGYQMFSVKWSDNSGANLFSNTDNWTRLSLTVRGDFHFISKQHFSMYTGLRVGYNIYSMTTDANPTLFPNYTTSLNVTPSVFAVQAHIGLTYFFTPLIGINAEAGLAVGGPYVGAVGVKFKF